MAQFYNNRYSGESGESQWKRHIQKQAYIDDVTKSVINSTDKQTNDFSRIVSWQTKEINDNIQNASKEQIAAIEYSTHAICGTLEYGFELLSENLQDISYEIGSLRSEVNRMAAMLDWKLSLLIELQRINNLLLGNIAVLLRIPDIQKERQYHVEQGLKFLKNSIYDSDFYEDSLSNFLKAEKIEPTDYYVLHRIGLIYMYSTNHLDLLKAEEYFKKAAKYAIAETNSGASVSNNYLRADVSLSLAEQRTTIDSIKLQAAESYMFAARSCYIQGKLEQAIEYAKKGYSLVPQLTEAGFTQAKALAANNDDEQAAIVLENVINSDRFYSLKVIEDLDLCIKPSVQILLKKLQQEETKKVIAIIEYCKERLISGSTSREYLNKIIRLTQKFTYLTSKKAGDLLNKNRKWTYCAPFENEKQSNYMKRLMKVFNSLLTIQYYKNANGEFILNDSNFITPYIKMVNSETQWIFPSYEAMPKTFTQPENIISKNENLNIVEFIELERKYNDALPSFLVKMEDLCRKLEHENSVQCELLEKKWRKLSNSNLAASFFGAIFGCIGGGAAGFVLGILLGCVFYVGSCAMSSGSYGSKADFQSLGTFVMIIGSLIGFGLTFTGIRIPYPTVFKTKNNSANKWAICTDYELNVILEKSEKYPSDFIIAAKAEKIRRTQK